MTSGEIRAVIPSADGTWRVLEPDCKRASAVADTLDEAEARARKILRNLGGGELRLCGPDGEVLTIRHIPPQATRTAPGGRTIRTARGTYGLG